MPLTETKPFNLPKSKTKPKTVTKRKLKIFRPFPKKDYRVNPFGEVETDNSDMTEFIALFSCETKEDLHAYYKLFFTHIRSITKIPLCLETGDRFYALIEREEFTYDYKRVITYILNTAYHYTANTAVMNSLFHMYKSTVSMWRNHRYMHSVLSSEEVVNLNLSVLYYSKPEKLKFVMR
jgi:hypothetical protein